MKRICFFVILVLWAVSCIQPKVQNSAGNNLLTSDTIRYAQGFTVHHFDGYTAVEVRDPWDSTRLLQRYLLVDRERPVPENLPKGTVVRVPARNIVVYTSVHAAIIDQLGETGRIIGVCEPRYMDTPAIQEGLKAGRIADMGEADYMESLPLGRTEWIRFYGMLFGKEALADSIFRQTEKNYLDLKRLVKADMPRPTVISEKKFGASWFMPAGDSYIANMYADAGADYVFKELPGAGSTPLAFETVLDRAIHADMWLVKYNRSEDMTYGDLRAEYTPYENFDAFKNRRVYSCNTGLVPYYEEFPLHPDYLLKDLIWVFHPELLPGYTPRYYRKMQD